MSRLFRWLNWGMVALFLLSVVVQYNDPDPVRWMAIYGAALAVCLVVAVRGRIAVAAPILVGLVALIWGLDAIVTGPEALSYSHMFDAWEMKTLSVEEAREASGLMIVTVWMFVVAIRQRRGSRGV